MSHVRRFSIVGLLALMAALGNVKANAEEIKTVFVIAMENHNWTQPANQFTGGIQQIFQNPNAPFINSLVNGTAVAIVDGRAENISRAGGLCHELSQRAGDAGRQQSAYPSFRTELSVGGGGHQFRRAQ